MNTKELKKLYRERDKCSAQLAALIQKQSDTEKRITELENLDIIQLVREARLIPETLAGLINRIKDTPAEALKIGKTEETDEKK